MNIKDLVDREGLGNKPEESVVHLNRNLWYFNYIKNKSGEDLKNKLEDFEANIRII